LNGRVTRLVSFWNFSQRDAFGIISDCPKQFLNPKSFPEFIGYLLFLLFHARLTEAVGQAPAQRRRAFVFLFQYIHLHQLQQLQQLQPIPINQ